MPGIPAHLFLGIRNLGYFRHPECDTAAELKIRQAWFLDHPFSQGLIQHAGMIGAPPIVYPVTAFTILTASSGVVSFFAYSFS